MTAQRDEDRAITTATYRDSARVLADKFDRLGARKADIEQTLSFCKQKHPNVLEVGCGNGRDAEAILPLVESYLGIDISPELIEIARNKVPGARFEVADVMEFPFPSGLDAVFAFASLIHLDHDEIFEVLAKVSAALNLDGVMMISMKWGEYRRVVQEDDFGTRIFYTYTPEMIEDLSLSSMRTAWVSQKNLIGQEWFEIILRKV
ncbi:hypothetical protein COY93_02330 [Candidatus Uhrbacteria bacterium CG_4_10_14_0_8_um_filter_58_22]|uniref:Methyltransferase domain-containing protein n=1 Tax=Candidatus Uhrbacteria bacterium CG_4_10_14_0_8_um_filter_58_22 TaxID=1975029 RepID=A0A2M7QB58_9BACT|nr:MAG: hypothetical protein AUJ19_02470 [Parcubacteria group bacterium CG1_02_58_44]PIY62810.1 MAG: hypothetical protein COY93_02330 [Candidatus Uhrbacteria bacterium CG_4_10_14_0_8_um_filter_58_22]